MTLTFGFDPVELSDHFQRHGKDFGAGSEQEYEQQAVQFLAGGKGCLTIECSRGNIRNVAKYGDRLRYNLFTKEFGILKKSGVISSYYKPRREKHGRALNLLYFMQECKK